MKRCLLILLAVAAAAALAVAMTGCGGSSSSSFRGLEVSPEDNDTDVPLDTWIMVAWDEPYDPPAEFSMQLEKQVGQNSWEGVETVLDDDSSSSIEQEWWFVPVEYLDEFTWYRIIVEDDRDRRKYFEFRTSDWYIDDLSGRRSPDGETKPVKQYRPAGKEKADKPTGKGALEHLIHGR